MISQYIIGLGIWCLTHFQQYFSYIVAISFIGGGNGSTWRKPSICCKSRTNFIIKYCIEYISLLMGFELTTLVVIGTECIGIYTSNYHTIPTTKTSPLAPPPPLHYRETFNRIIWFVSFY